MRYFAYIVFHRKRTNLTQFPYSFPNFPNKDHPTTHSSSHCNRRFISAMYISVRKRFVVLLGLKSSNKADGFYAHFTQVLPKLFWMNILW